MKYYLSIERTMSEDSNKEKQFHKICRLNGAAKSPSIYTFQGTLCFFFILFYFVLFCRVCVCGSNKCVYVCVGGDAILPVMTTVF
uniref:Uncharacterized protein n=1 Tax=Anguilla anguilla TaxID=7936 RepID=A0A0E9X8P7_ANGAN